MSIELEAFEQIKKYLVNLHFHFLEEELDIIEKTLKRNIELEKENEILQIIRDNFDLWIESNYRATLQFQQCCTMTQSDYERLIKYFGEPRDD